MRFLFPAGLAGAAVAGLFMGQATVRGMPPPAIAEAYAGEEGELGEIAVACIECGSDPSYGYDDARIPGDRVISPGPRDWRTY